MEIMFNITEKGGKAAFSFAKWQHGKWRLSGCRAFSPDGLNVGGSGMAISIVLLGSPEGDSGSRLEMF